MVMKSLVLCLLSALVNNFIYAQTACGNVQLQLTPDYSFAIGSSSGGTAYSFTLGGQPLAQGPMTQLALFHYDNSLISTSGVAPSVGSGVAYDTGKFGEGVYLQSGSGIKYPGNILDVSEGTIEM